jgi:hypothetical protein
MGEHEGSLVLAPAESTADVLAQSAIGLQLLLGEQLLHRGFLRKVRIPPLVVGHVVVLVAAHRGFDVDQNALLSGALAIPSFF